MVGQIGLWVVQLLGSILLVILAVLVILYFRGSFRGKISYRMKNVPPPTEPHFFRAIAGLARSIPTQANPTDFYVEADEIYAARLKGIQSAQHSIHFETFYMTPGRRADDFALALMERAQAGVKVQVIVDKHGTSSMPDRYWKTLEAAGVEVGFFRAFDWRAPLDYHLRTHRKLLLIDGKVAFLGGAGVSDEWDGKGDTGSSAPWRDFEVRYEGPIVNILEGVFMENWADVGCTLDLSPSIFQDNAKTGNLAFVTVGNFSLEDSSLRILFHTSMHAATRRIWISSPYFVPDNHTQEVMLSAKARGIDVRILTMGIHNDKPLVYYTARELYPKLLKGGVDLFEYQPNMLHAKVLLVDDEWVSHGSTNVDQRSFFQNDEMNVSMSNAALAKHMEQFLLESFARSRHITLADWNHRPLSQQLMGRFGLLFRQLF